MTGTRGGKRKETLWRQTDRHHKTPWQSQQPRAAPQHPLWIGTWEHHTRRSVRVGTGDRGVPCTHTAPSRHSFSCCESPSMLGPSGARPPGTGRGTQGDSKLCLSVVWPQPPLFPRSCCSLGPHPLFWGAHHPTHPLWALQAPGALEGVALVWEPHSPLLLHPSHLPQRDMLAPGPLSATWGCLGALGCFS